MAGYDCEDERALARASKALSGLPRLRQIQQKHLMFKAASLYWAQRSLKAWTPAVMQYCF
jgi:hypothetical protein